MGRLVSVVLVNAVLLRPRFPLLLQERGEAPLMIADEAALRGGIEVLDTRDADFEGTTVVDSASRPVDVVLWDYGSLWLLQLTLEKVHYLRSNTGIFEMRGQNCVRYLRKDAERRFKAYPRGFDIEEAVVTDGAFTPDGIPEAQFHRLWCLARQAQR